jgi:hypothetical protein
VRPAAIIAAVGVLLVLWTFESPVDPVAKGVWQNVHHASGETQEYAGFHWIATHTPEAAVLAVDARATPTSCFQTAFAARRALIDCYFGFAPEQTLQSADDLRRTLPPSLFREVEARLRLNNAIFQGHAAALAEAARRYGVRYVVVDLASGGTAGQARAIGRVADPVFRNAAVAVFRVRPTA